MSHVEITPNKDGISDIKLSTKAWVLVYHAGVENVLISTGHVCGEVTTKHGTIELFNSEIEMVGRMSELDL